MVHAIALTTLCALILSIAASDNFILKNNVTSGAACDNEAVGTFGTIELGSGDCQYHVRLPDNSSTRVSYWLLNIEPLTEGSNVTLSGSRDFNSSSILPFDSTGAITIMDDQVPDGIYVKLKASTGPIYIEVSSVTVNCPEGQVALYYLHSTAEYIPSYSECTNAPVISGTTNSSILDYTFSFGGWDQLPASFSQTGFIATISDFPEPALDNSIYALTLISAEGTMTAISWDSSDSTSEIDPYSAAEDGNVTFTAGPNTNSTTLLSLYFVVMSGALRTRNDQNTSSIRLEQLIANFIPQPPSPTPFTPNPTPPPYSSSSSSPASYPPVPHPPGIYPPNYITSLPPPYPSGANLMDGTVGGDSSAPTSQPNGASSKAPLWGLVLFSYLAAVILSNTLS